MKLYIDISTEEKKNEVFELFKTFSFKKEIFDYYGVSNNTLNNQYITDIAKQIGFDFSVYKQKQIQYCKYCGKELNNSRKQFCNSSCAASYNNKLRGKPSEETKEKISRSLKHEKVQNKEFSKSLPVKALTFKDKLFKNGIKERKCEICGLTEWNGKEIVLQLHHINGIHNDNRIENLQILCPNCHSQTDNFCSKNRKKYSVYEKKTCNVCGKELSYTNKSGMCQVCYNEHYNKTSKPPKETMLNDMQTYKSYSSLSRYYHVSSKTLQKWFKQDNIDFI